ncbi:ABC transporter substrate-binding protein [Pelagibacterium montanilacus]|uniref:ABC transporter substrate-binding protein n=1 Tax=Pelagibacterium montanilacus TaxID=2185280 RepID=UPI000F8D8DC0|nr:ABC transporter substrate-binding protein [Pelagibacterium montanilacus]
MIRLLPALLASTVTFATGSAMAQNVPVNFTLDWAAQGPHSWFYLAEERGYFEDEGIDITIDQGEGSAAAVSRVMTGAYDAGFGDINAVIQAAATEPEDAPVMVYLVYNRAPFAIISKADGPVQELPDVEGRVIASPAGSATFRLFPALAEANGFDGQNVEVLNAAQNLIEQMLISGDAEAIAQFGATSYMNFIAMGLDPETDFNWFFYSDNGLDLYSNGVIVSRAMIEEQPEVVAGLVRAINRAVLDVVSEPQAGIDVLMEIEPLNDADLEMQRLQYTIDNQLYTDETGELGIGHLSMDRLASSIETIAEVYELEAAPEVEAIFDPAFLPPAEERMLP